MTTVEVETGTLECDFRKSKSCFEKVPAKAAKKLGFVHIDPRTGVHRYICQPCAEVEKQERKLLYRDLERTIRESPN